MSRHEGPAEAGRLDRAVAALVPELSRSRAASLIKDGRVLVDGEVIVKVSHAVTGGTLLIVDIPAPVSDRAEPQDLPIRIVYEDEDLAVVDKAAGMVVHPAPGHPDGTLVNALLFHLDGLSGIGGVQRPGIVHRLDKGTSGLLVVAKHDAAHLALSEQFANRTAGREYLALCVGVPKVSEGVVENRLGRHPVHRTRFTATRDGKRAVTYWKRVQRGRGTSLIRCSLETGRTHQVRVHLSELGFPIVGDPVYGGRQRSLPKALRELQERERPLLHATELHLVHPTSGEQMSWHAPPPEDFVAACATVGIAL